MMLRLSTCAAAMLIGSVMALIPSCGSAKSYRMDVVLSLSEDGRLTICPRSRFSTDGMRLFRSVAVDDPSVDPWTPVWELYAEGAHVRPVACFTYGEPAGDMKETVSPSELEVGKTYRLQVSAPGEHALVLFRLANADGKQWVEVIEDFEQ
jgi:hypothetical protein